jgi:minor extracellular serine protease Vpr
VRRAIVLLTLATMLGTASAAAAALQPVRRDFGGQTVPRLRFGTLNVPPGHSSGTVRVIVSLPLAPLAVANSRSLALRAAARRRLDASSAFARGYLATLARAQGRAVAALHRAIPEARVSWRYRVVLDGFAVTVPYRRLPALYRLGFVRHVYAVGRYRLDLNRSPSLIGAPQLIAATGAKGDGMKIGIIDDGIDQTSSFFNPAGFSYPPGFPKGDTAFTTPKVIVARAFPGPNSGAGGKLPLDRHASFHGTHVAGIAAGDAGTFAPAGIDHPAVSGLSGVAPRAQLGNYRIFNVPVPFTGCCVAEDPEIVKAMDSAVQDGMNVINMSLGAPETDPSTSALIPAVHNTTVAGVVTAIAAGNDRDDFGLGSVGSPGTAPDAITVGAVSNSHIFARALALDAPGGAGLGQVPAVPGLSGVPNAWAASDQPIVDVATVRGVGGAPVDPHLCGSPRDLNGPTTPLPARSLAGVVALVQRGDCTFTSKAQRVEAAGGVGMIVADNRPGDPNFIPDETAVPTVMVSDLDGTRLRAALGGAGGRGAFRLGRDALELPSDHAGVPASFSSAGLTPFGHDLKPDISAPGEQVLSSTLPEFIGEPFAVFDGTSMAAPHIAGAAALLLELHPSWTPAQVKSALMSTAAPTFADTARTSEAPVLVEGAGLAQLPAANDPRIFTAPQSLSFHYLDVLGGAQSRLLQVTVSDAGGGSGTWSVSVSAQSSSAGASLSVPASIAVPASGSATLTVTASAPADAAAGDDYGFVVLTNGTIRRRIPYDFVVTRPRLASVQAIPLERSQEGDTRKGTDHAETYRWPTAGLGPFVQSVLGPTKEVGADRLYVVDLKKRVVNVGAAIVSESSTALVDPWFLGSPDENDVLGYAGTPADANGAQPFEYRIPVGAAGAVFAPAGRYYVSVDSGRNPYTGTSFAGHYVLRSWVNDVTPPRVRLITTSLAAGHPTLVLRALDSGAGVDPLSIIVAYGRTLVGAAAFDPATGLAIVPLPSQAPALSRGPVRLTLVAADYQEAKNVDTVGSSLLPNTAFAARTLHVGSGPTLYWLYPAAGECAQPSTHLLVATSDTSSISSVRFYDGKRRISTVSRSVAGLFPATWKTGRAVRGTHTLKAVLLDQAGRTAQAARTVRVCSTKR